MVSNVKNFIGQNSAVLLALNVKDMKPSDTVFMTFFCVLVELHIAHIMFISILCNAKRGRKNILHNVLLINLL